MTLSISPTRSGLTTTIVCKGCEHEVEVPHGRGPLELWIDSNGDCYFQGTSLQSLREFAVAHADPWDYHPVEPAAVARPICKTCSQPIRPSDNDPWTWQHA